MQTIKTYKNVLDSEVDFPLAIRRMEDYWEKQQKQPDLPHRHGYYTVLFIIDADGEHIIDFNKYKMSKNQVFFVAPGQVHQIIENRQSKGYVITFGSGFLAQSGIPQNFIDGLDFFVGYGETPPLFIDNNDISILSGYCEEMLKAYSTPMRYKQQAIGSLLQLFLIKCNNLCSLDISNTQDRESGQQLYTKFIDLLENNYKKEHGLQFYADNLYVSPDHLSKVIKNNTGRSAKEIIQDRIITAAKRDLYFTDMASKEIGYALGFDEPSNFSAFFKKCIGMSPSSFRKTFV